ncbi:MAG: hypothetical protein HOU81_07480 [Hamadaea sp.]|uniref:hypothetical protein n=1 Tax=Hamadaea sp. TaxID=2024425 RepID=UPI0017977609|nr:hypothetical protein [Hamadaea sp.]NUR70646.1 hypothetical protein [Hamadaea sp.]NUT20781.1 hypothetical protein [Hamadaea sp.]
MVESWRPPRKRQPQLVLAAVRLLGGPVDDPAAFCEYAVGAVLARAGNDLVGEYWT